MQRFDHIAVREFEGVDVCNKYFDVQADRVLDPVFLLDVKRWGKLADRSSVKTQNKFLFAYLLDPSHEKITALKKLADTKCLELVSITDRQFNQEKS